MSLKLQGLIIRFPLQEYALTKNIKISKNSISQLKLLWISLADFQNEKSGQCNPSMGTLSKCIEKSTSQTVVYMNKLKELGLVVASRNAKGGRYTPQYELLIPCRPADGTVSHPADNTPHISSDTSPPEETFEASDVQDPTPPIYRTRILIEPLDESLIKSLINERDISKRNTGLVGVAEKYGFEVKNNTPIHEVEIWLLKAINQSTPHRTNYGTH